MSWCRQSSNGFCQNEPTKWINALNLFTLLWMCSSTDTQLQLHRDYTVTQDLYIYAYQLRTKWLFVSHCCVYIQVLTVKATMPHYLLCLCVSGVIQQLNPCQLLTMACCVCERPLWRLCVSVCAHACAAAVGSMYVLQPVAKTQRPAAPKAHSSTAAFMRSQITAAILVDCVNISITIHVPDFTLWPKISLNTMRAGFIERSLWHMQHS